jgi:hypothetical protein
VNSSAAAEVDEIRTSRNQGRPRFVLRETGSYGVGILSRDDIKKGAHLRFLVTVGLSLRFVFADYLFRERQHFFVAT